MPRMSELKQHGVAARAMNTRTQATPSAKNASPVPGASPTTEKNGHMGRGRTTDMVASTSGARLALVTDEQDAPVLGADGTPLHEAPQATSDRCARHADELATHAEQVGRLAKALLHGPACPDPAWTQKFTRVVMAQLRELRVLANGLGELHTELDELAAELTPSPRATAGEVAGGAR